MVMNKIIPDFELDLNASQRIAEQLRKTHEMANDRNVFHFDS